MLNWQSYSAICKDKKITNPYKDESDFNRAYNIQNDEPITPVFVARKSSSHKHILPTLENHEKKLKAPKRKNLFWCLKKVA